MEIFIEAKKSHRQLDAKINLRHYEFKFKALENHNLKIWKSQLNCHNETESMIKGWMD